MSAHDAQSPVATESHIVRAAQAYGVDADTLRRLHAQEQTEVPRKAAIAAQARVLGFGARSDALPLQRQPELAAG